MNSVNSWRGNQRAGFGGPVLVAVVGLAAASVVFYNAFAENERRYTYHLDSGELHASGSIRWTVRNEGSEAEIWINVGTTREAWEHTLEHDSQGRVVAWLASQGDRIAEWRYTDGECTLTTPEGVQTVQGCEPLPHPLLQTVECLGADCSYNAPNLRFTALETREWRRGPEAPEAAVDFAGEMLAVSSSDGEVWWYASGDHTPDYMTLPGGLVWHRPGAPPLPDQLRQPPPLSVSGDAPRAGPQTRPAAAGASALTVSGDAPGETPATEFEISGPGVASIREIALNAGRQMGFHSRDGTIRVSMRQEPVSSPATAVTDTENVSPSAVAAQIMRDVHAEIEPRRTAARVSAEVVAERGFGDCTDMAVLAVARLQEHGIHARVVAGVAYVDEWSLHAWVEFEHHGAGGTTWRSADPTTGEVPAPADRIRLATDLNGMERLSGEIQLRPL